MSWVLAWKLGGARAPFPFAAAWLPRGCCRFPPRAGTTRSCCASGARTDELVARQQAAEPLTRRGFVATADRTVGSLLGPRAFATKVGPRGLGKSHVGNAAGAAPPARRALGPRRPVAGSGKELRRSDGSDSDVVTLLRLVESVVRWHSILYAFAPSGCCTCWRESQQRDTGTPAVANAVTLRRSSLRQPSLLQLRKKDNCGSTFAGCAEFYTGDPNKRHDRE
eukprot:scaffold128682_cov63-Phaeocystis_antarctica.AAC.4